jgi:hypothetical protein
MPVCEGCGTRSDELHIQRRSQRLRLAQKYRPASIRILYLDSAPPARMEDFFYFPATDRAMRSLASRYLFDELMKTMGAAPGAEKSEEAALAEFCRRGFFLSCAVDCPFEDLPDPQGTLRRVAPTAIKRIQTELEPAYIVPLSRPTQDLIRLFGMVGWGDRLILDKGGPFVDTFFGGSKNQATLAGPSLGERIRKAIAVLP